MKATKVLELLQAGKIKELESELKNEIMLETSNTTGSKAANQKAIFKHLQKLDREVLRKCIYKDGYQYYTDTLFMVKVSESNKNVLIPEVNEKEDGKYPELTRIIESTLDNRGFEITLNTKDILNVFKLKQAKCLYVVDESGQNYIFTAKDLKHAMQALNYNQETITFKFSVNSLHPFYFKNNDDLAIITCCKCYQMNGTYFNLQEKDFYACN